jgi:prefoldin subunit 4
MDNRVLSKEDESSEKILKEDQEKINLFARLNNRLGNIKDELADLKKQRANLDDAASELVLADEGVKFLVGEVFVDMATDEAEKLLEKSIQENSAGVVTLDNEKAKIVETMNQLKVQLYAKFGRSINLETDADD